MSLKKRTRVLYTAVLTLQLVGGLADAGITWNVSGSGSWDTSTANWIGDSTTFTSDGTVDVIFNDSAGGTVLVLR